MIDLGEFKKKIIFLECESRADSSLKLEFTKT